MKREEFAAFAPRAVAPDEFVVALNACFPEFEINTPARIRHFMAQAAHESGGFTRMVENLNYSAAGLLATWPSRYTKELAAQHARHPETIANYVYGNRLGNTAPGDGWTYRGHGIFQLTGKDAFAKYGEKIGLDLVGNPDLAAEPRNAVRIACLYWRDKGLSALADRGDIVAITRRINGGVNGLDERKAWFAKAERIFR